MTKLLVTYSDGDDLIVKFGGTFEEATSHYQQINKFAKTQSAKASSIKDLSTGSTIIL